jgi:MFS family permease
MTDKNHAARIDILLLYLARGVRGFGDGFAIIILPAYLAALGFSATQIGFVLSASLLGTALLTLGVGFIAPGHDLRNLLLAGAFLMIATGVVFPNVELLAVMAIVAFVGTINPSTGDLGVLVPLEHAMLAQEAPDPTRSGSTVGAACRECRRAR